jgi:hypothetical protein
MGEDEMLELPTNSIGYDGAVELQEQLQPVELQERNQAVELPT